MRRILLLLVFILSQEASQAQFIETVNGILSLKPINSKTDIINFLDESKKSHLILSYKKILNEEELKDLSTIGINTIGFIPPNSYVVEIAATDNDISSSIYNYFNGISSIPIALKLSKEIYVQYDKKEINFDTEFIITFYHTSERIEIIKQLEKINVIHRVHNRLNKTSLLVKIQNIEQLEEILSIEAVSFIDVFKEEKILESSSNSMFCNQIFSLNYDRNGPSGRNTYFSNIEHFGSNSLFRLNTKGRNHPLYGTNYPDNTITLSPSHGTSVSMYAASSNNVNEYENRGMAEEATLIQMPSYGLIEDYYTAKNLKPLTLNVSAGIGGTSVNYNSLAADFDRITRLLKGFTLCFSAGNDGNSTNTSLNYGPGWANISGDHKTAKNTITVHSAGKPAEHFDWACKGPTADGRLKPDICAEGRYGTSYASPNLAGLVNVLYESYQNSYQTIARSDVVKAVILNTAVDADKEGIDYKTGFGTVNPSRAHKIIQEKKIFTGTMPQGANNSQQFQINVPAGLKQLRVLLYWHDYPGTEGAARALVNNLDLRVIDPSSNTILPWVLDATPGNQYNLPLQKNDTLNNVEQVTINNPSAGTYTFLVKGSSVPFGPQDFALTYDLLPYHIEITSPVAGFRAARNRTILFTWNSSLATDNPNNTLEIILQKQSNESVVLATVPATQKYYSYIVPGSFPYSSTARLIVRQKNTPYSDTSDYFHVMESPTGLNFKTICPEQITLTWAPVSVSNVEYIIYHLGEKFMEEVGRVNSPINSITLSAASVLGTGKQFGSEEWFAIAAKHQNGAISLRSDPISNKQTNLLSTAAPLSKQYLLCYGDSAVASAFNLQRDSIRWFYNFSPIPNSNSLSIKLKGNKQGLYYYKIYQSNGCVFTSDSFIVNGPVAYTDTLKYGERDWKIYVYKNNDRKQFYGKLTIKATSINSLLYYTEFQQINSAVGYEGCAPGNIYTISYKRKGFTKGLYKMNLSYVQYQIRIFLNGNLIYTSPSNSINVGDIWQGMLSDTDEIRIEHLVQGRAIINLDIIPINYVVPGGVKNGISLWLKADKAITNQQGYINRWIDSYVNSYQNSAESAAKITVKPNGINYNPSILFNKSGGLFGQFQTTQINGEATTIAVFKMNTNSGPKARVISYALPSIYNDDNYSGTYIPIGRKDNTSTIGTFRKDNEILAPGDRLNSWQMITTGVKSNSTSIASKGTIINSGAHSFPGLFITTINIGAKIDTIKNEGLLDGEIAEIIHYTRTLNTLEEQKLNSYLAIKYGITLNHAYRNSSGKIIYNGGKFNRNIAGIGREDNQELLQKQSRNTEGEIDIFSGSIGRIELNNQVNNSNISKDSSFVIWGHNGTSLSYNISMPDSSMRMQRMWKLKTTNFSETMRFNFEDSSILKQENCTLFYLYILSPIDTNAITAVPLDFYSAGDGKVYAYADVNLNNDSIYFSLARKTITVEYSALPKHTSTSMICIKSEVINVLDSLNHGVAQLIADDTTISKINSITVYTNEELNKLAACNDTSRITVINRFVEVHADNINQSLFNIKLYLDNNDSLDATNNSILHTCKAFRNKLRWFIETNKNDLYQKISNTEPLNWLDPSNIEYNSIEHYVIIKNLNQNELILGVALYDTSKKVIINHVNQKKSSNIQIYPNPMFREFNIKNISSFANIEIYNTLGQCVYINSNTNSPIVLPDSIYPGIYLLKISENGIYLHSEKIIIY